ncbi:MAG: hypothetical protein ACKVHP_11785 [Verrucomicrobiales bacterium]
MDIPFDTGVGRTYRVETTDTIGTGAVWFPLIDQVQGTGNELMVTDPNALLRDRRFYRLVQTP